MTDTNQDFESLSPEEREAKAHQWMTDEYMKVVKFCASQGINIQSSDNSKSRCLPPLIGIWNLVTMDKPPQKVWAISGDFPTDVVGEQVGSHAREVLKHFSMSWQLKAAKLEEGIASGRVEMGDKETQKKFAEELSRKAELLHALCEDEQFWQGA